MSEQSQPSHLDEKHDPSIVHNYLNDFFRALQLVMNAMEYSQVRSALDDGSMPWWMGTFFYFARFIDEDACFRRFTSSGMKTLVHLAEGWKKRHPERIKEMALQLRIANNEINKGFPTLYSRHIVALWNMLDATLSDSLVQLFKARPETLDHRMMKKITFTLIQYQHSSRDQLLRMTVAELKRRYGIGKYCKGVRVYKCIYADLGMDEKLSHELDKSLIELRSARNVFVHNMGIADERFTQDCPWLPIEKGEPVNITESQYDVYASAAMQYAVNVLMAQFQKFVKDIS